MEKTPAGDGKHQWRIAAPDYIPKHPYLSVLDLTCCPCGGYSRMRSYVRSFVDGRPIIIKEEDGFFTKDCILFFIFLPCYCCFITRLQEGFRRIHGIKGNQCTDCLAACFCPASSVSRMEMESLVRQQEKRLNQGLPSIFNESTSSSSSNGDKYTPQAPMLYPKHTVDQMRPDLVPDTMKTAPKKAGSHGSKGDGYSEPAPDTRSSLKKEKTTSKIKTDKTKSATHSNKDSAYDSSTLESIPESSREPSVAVPRTSEQRAKGDTTPKRSKRHSLQDDLIVPVKKSKRWPLLEYLGKKWYMVPLDQHDDEDQTEEYNNNNNNNEEAGDGSPGKDRDDSHQEIKSPIVSLREQYRHSLVDDQQYVESKTAAHTLNDDILTPSESTAKMGRAWKHSLGDDRDRSSSPLVNKGGHSLEEDPSPQPAPITPIHQLAEDTSIHRSRPVASHRLEEDEESHSNRSVQVHNLQDDHASSRIGLPSLQHHLDADPSSGTVMRTTMHNIHEDETGRRAARLDEEHDLHGDLLNEYARPVSMHPVRDDPSSGTARLSPTHRVGDDSSSQQPEHSTEHFLDDDPQSYFKKPALQHDLDEDAKH